MELSLDLARVAEANIERWRAAGNARCPARVVCGDATEIALPEGNCLVYLANPFGAVVVRRLLEQIEARRPRDGGGALPDAA